MTIFLVANILGAVLTNGYPAFTYTSSIVSLADHNAFNVFTSPVCLAIAFYFAEKKSNCSPAKYR